jgi:4-hydroxybenzoate polyprenyltransferase
MYGQFQKINANPLDFFLLVFSTVLIAAGGNIINDYFDVKADRINKPEKLIITKHIKRRWAIVTHWSFNGIAFLIAIYLSAKYQTLWLVFIHLLSINLLWFYSMLFKRKVLIGNLMIAGLTGLIPLLVLVFFKVSNWYNPGYSTYDPTNDLTNIDYSIVYGLAVFALIQNLAREIVKDCQDVKGDELIYAKSLPMVLGEQKSLMLVKILLLIFPLFCLLFGVFKFEKLISLTIRESVLISIPFLLIAIANSLTVVLMNKTNGLRLVTYNHLIKLIMLLGILSTYYFGFFIS